MATGHAAGGGEAQLTLSSEGEVAEDELGKGAQQDVSGVVEKEVKSDVMSEGNAETEREGWTMSIEVSRETVSGVG